MNGFARIVAALWLGSGFFLVIAASAAFAAAGDATTAADVVGAMLSRWHYIALLAPVILLLIEWRRARTAMIALTFLAVVFAASQGFIDLRIRTIRASSPMAISAMPRNSPLRRHFGMLHGLSSLLLVVQVLVAMVTVVAQPEPKPKDAV